MTYDVTFLDKNDNIPTFNPLKYSFLVRKISELDQH